MATFPSGIAEFERYLITEGVRSDFAVAKDRGKKLGRMTGDRLKCDRLAPKMELVAIARDFGISENTVGDPVHRLRPADELGSMRHSKG